MDEIKNISDIEQDEDELDYAIENGDFDYFMDLMFG